MTDLAHMNLSATLAHWGSRLFAPNSTDDPRPDDDALPKRINSARLDYETPAEYWEPQSTAEASLLHALLPRHFIDGKAIIKVIGGSRDEQGIPRPILAGQIGAGWFDLEGQHDAKVQRVLVINCNGLSDSHVEQIETDAAVGPDGGFLLIPYISDAASDPDQRDFNAVQRLMYVRARHQMFRWERDFTQAFAPTPVYVDGRVQEHLFADRVQLAIGLVKSLMIDFLHPRGHAVRDALAPGQRTPAALLRPDDPAWPAIVTFYMRLSDTYSGPTSGIIRVEIRQDAFEQIAGGDSAFLNSLAAHLYQLRCVRPDYSRAEVMTEPMYEVEQIIGAHFVLPSLVTLEAQTFLFS